MIFVQKQYEYLVPVAMQQEYIATQFDNRELLLKLTSCVQGQACMVVGSLTAPADQVLELLLLLHTLQKSGIQRLRLFSPYLGYQRQDSQHANTSHGLQYADALLFATGVQQIITIESHNLLALQGLQVPVHAYSAAHIFEQEMARFVTLGFGFVFPDYGASSRYQWIAEKFPGADQAYFTKKRIFNVVDLQSFQGKVGRKVIVYDDILDSGQTLLQVCIALRHMGVEEIVIFVTHAFFYGDAWKELWNFGVKILYCTNSVSAAHKINHPAIYAFSIMDFLQRVS